MAFNWNFKPKTRKGFYSAPVESLMPQAPGAIPTQMKGQVNLPELEQPFDFNSYFTDLVNREEMDGYHPVQNFSVPNQQHGGNPAVNYDGYSPTTPMTEQDVINQNLAERQTSNADDMANWIQQGGTPQADAAAAAQTQAEQEAAAKEQQIADIESQISALEKRIKENTTKLNNWSGNADQIAAIEARKINSQDPTMIWRWKADKDEARRIAKMEKEKTKSTQQNNVKFEIDNTLSSIIPRSDASSEEIQRDITKLYDLRTLAQKNEMPKSEIDKIDARIDLLRNPKSESSDETGEKKDIFDDMTNLNTPEKKNARVELLLQHPEKTKPGDWAEVLKNPDGMNKNLVIKAKAEYGKALDRQKATQDRNDMKADYKKRTGKDFDQEKPEIQEFEIKRWKRKKSKK